MKIIQHENTNQKKAKVVILISDKLDFRKRLLPGIMIMIKSTSQQINNNFKYI